MPEGKDPLDAIFEDDPFGLLDVQRTERAERTQIDRLVESFEEINAFYAKFGREPNDSEAEFHLRARLDGIRESPEKVAILAPHDRHGLLKADREAPPNSIDELFESDPFCLLDQEADDIFDLKNIPTPVSRPEYVAKRRPCRDFDRYKPLFEQCQADLNSGKRYTMSFSREGGIEVGDFFILRGLLTYVADKRDPVMKDGEPNYRLRCIFSNGTESDLLMLSLARDLYRHGRRVSREGEARLGLEDATGIIYVVRSLSDHPEVTSRSTLFKLGFSRGRIEDRIRNAERDPTYLMAPVRLVTTFQVNVNVAKLEHLLHVFFADAQVELQVIGDDGTAHTPREWFDVPLEAIEEAVHLMVNGTIVDYRYDVSRRRIVKR